ncbi:MAG TPA: hypothetical protein VGD67_07495, partial [Pseudonocardiaceae bacterium]
MPGSADRDAELFARALDHGPEGLERPLDEALERELDLVRLLAVAGDATAAAAGPDEVTRERMRRRVLAGLAATPPMTGVATRPAATGTQLRPSPVPRGRTGEGTLPPQRGETALPGEGVVPAGRAGEGTAAGVGPREA